jgi:hypothetical protein
MASNQFVQRYNRRTQRIKVNKAGLYAGERRRRPRGSVPQLCRISAISGSMIFLVRLSAGIEVKAIQRCRTRNWQEMGSIGSIRKKGKSEY